MKEVLESLSALFLDKKKFKKIKKIKNAEEKKILFENSLTSFLAMKHLDLEIKIKKISDPKKKKFFILKSNVISPKIIFLRTDFHEESFKKINSLLDKLEEEIKCLNF
jgi:hypothetical protein